MNKVVKNFSWAILLALISGCSTIEAEVHSALSVSEALSVPSGRNLQARGYLRVGDDHSNLWSRRENISPSSRVRHTEDNDCITLSLSRDLKQRFQVWDGKEVIISGVSGAFVEGELDALWSCSGSVHIIVTNMRIADPSDL